MTAGALSCTVLVDGVRVADGSPTDNPLNPVVLDDLGITWGRATTLDQPSASSCSLLVRDRTGGEAFLDLLVVGKRLDVRTDATVWPADPTVPTITDPSFTTTGPGRITDNATVTVTAGHAVLVHEPTPTRRARVIFAPAAFQPAGTNPAAWDTIPKTSAGQTWAYGATVTLPVAMGAQVVAGTIRPVAFTAPWASTARVLEDFPVTVLDGVPTIAPFTPPPGVWLGVAIDVYPAGPAWAQLDPALTWALVNPAITWDALARTLIDDLVVLAPAAGTTRSAYVFSGRITDLAASRDGDATLVAVTAQDHTSELANRDIFDTPWPVQTLAARAARIIALAGQATTITVDPAPAAVQVTRQDVDNLPALRLLQELAATVDGVLWSATHLITGQYLHLVDLGARPPFLVLSMVGAVVVIVPNPNPAAAYTRLSSCDVLLSAEWVQDVADVATRVAVTWQEQTVAPEATVARVETVTDANMVERLGVRRVAVNTRLTTATAAATVAAAVLARTSDTSWRITDLTWDTGMAPLDQDQVAAAFTLLDGTTRLGAPVLVTDLPDWSPTTGDTTGVFLEGGQYSYTGGDWVLDLTVSSARNQGRSVTWAQLDPGWSWDEFDPAISWADLTGVGI